MGSASFFFLLKDSPSALLKIQDCGLESLKLLYTFIRAIPCRKGYKKEGLPVLLHAFAHNPMGVDPTVKQWEQIIQLIRSEGLLPFFDSANQGFVRGNLDTNAQHVRMFTADGGNAL
ncbi:hypothetical protein F3Y22_tig00110186pilonHSYRG00024 [Hibiscus syriacus]|uniref:Aminotransferase class I/classII large domain-containing protein n=1 Tax=Hibiscus syriacus TaxID=106335 RepID=A0A6A3BG90_HIBSY|nr:hypothetical protein F3Y22_tig00110186pilonHSYRG00024 [Hibiscus syriacus]